MRGGVPDIVPGFVQDTFPLPPDDAGPVQGTLVWHPDDDDRRPALLYVHGYNDYWFQEELAHTWRAAGYAFFALELRRHGRSLRQGQHPSYTSDMRLYEQELDEALARIRADRPDRPVVLMGHSTGGLICSLFAQHRPGALSALILNSPFFGFSGAPHERWLLRNVVPPVAAVEPRWVVQKDGGPVYASSLHRHFGRGGEWTYDLTWKRAGGLPLLAGWIRAAHQGHQAVAAGLDIRCPVLVLSSARSGGGHEWNDSYTCTDAVLDVREMRRRARGLGARVDQVVIEGALHDVILSRPPIRERAHREMLDWAQQVRDGTTTAQMTAGHK